MHMTQTTQQAGLISGALRRAANLALPLAIVLMLGVGWTQSAEARTNKETVIHAFTGFGNDGVNPLGPGTLLQDGAGNWYGTTIVGGAWDGGTVFRIDKTGKQTVLHSFHKALNGPGDGYWPNGGLAMDSAGNLYGTTQSGGANVNGTVFKLHPTGKGYKETLLHSFAGGTNDGGDPLTGLIRDSEGNLYGATYFGGANSSGVLFKLDTGGQLTVIYSFGTNPDEGTVVFGLAQDSNGNFYAASETGGPSQYSKNCIQTNRRIGFGCGTLAKIDSSGTETLLHVFTGVSGDGGSPMGPVLLDAAGNIYGTTLLGGSGSCQPAWSSTPGCGTVFKIDTSGAYSVIYNFPGTGAQGAGPINGLTMDQDGNLHGATEDGGIGTCNANGFNGGGYWTAYPGCGVIFKLTTAGKETVLHKFTGKHDGGNPEAGLLLDSSGNLFGTTYNGGDDNGCGSGQGCGVVFKIPK
jgi:uncharacterized repeat protein (TIGR03803 family)